jgi:quercetin dioxygenase-like cupin family protein
MIKKNYEDVKEEIVTKANSTKTTIRWLVTKEDGAKNFTMRRFEIQPGGEIGIHDHPEEHEIYILEGNGQVFDEKGNVTEISKNDVLFVPPNEPHGYKTLGDQPLIFICVIPYL